MPNVGWNGSVNWLCHKEVTCLGRQEAAGAVLAPALPARHAQVCVIARRDGDKTTCCSAVSIGRLTSCDFGG